MKLIDAPPAEPIRLALHCGGICLIPEAAELRTTVPREHEIFITEWFKVHEDNYGRRKAVLDPDSDNHNDRERLESLSDTGELQAREFMQFGGWSVWTPGVTGRPPGRPVKGVRGPDLIRQRIDQLAPGFEYESAPREERAELVVHVLAKPRPINRQALADYWGVSRSTITRLNALGKRLHQNSTNRGRSDSAA